jgi:hypothetical protein
MAADMRRHLRKLPEDSVRVTPGRHLVGMNADIQLAEFAARHNGVFTIADARSLGVPARTVRNREEGGRYIRLHPGVYAIAGSADSIGRAMAAAAKSFLMPAAISHQTAAELWSLTSRGIRAIEVVTTRWDRVHRDGLVVHESMDLIDDDIVERDGIAVTSAVRTVVDLGASNKWVVESALEQGIRLELFTLADVEAFVRRVARRGRRGVGVIRPLLAARKRWDSVTDSFLEDVFRKLMASAGLPRPVSQYEVRDSRGRFISRADFAYPASGLLIELDSEAHHMDRVTFRRDRSKQNAASVSGWTVLRYTWWDLVERQDGVVAEIQLAVGAPDKTIPA